MTTDPQPAHAPPIPTGEMYAIHYSCDVPEHCPGSTPAVSAVVVEDLASGVQTAFSAFHEAEAFGVQPDRFLPNLPTLESVLLRGFYAFVNRCPAAVWVHWGMRKPAFGFDVLAQRMALTAGWPPPIPADRRFDLLHHLKLRFGDEFAAHPYLPSAIAANLGAVPRLLDAEATAAAWRDGRHADVVASLSAKVGAIAKLFHRVRRGTFVTSCASGPGAGPDAQVEPAAAADRPVNGNAARRRGPADEAEVLVAAYLRSVAPRDPMAVKVRDVVAATGVSLGGVSKTPSWVAFVAKRKSFRSPLKGRAIPLSAKMLASISDDRGGNPADLEVVKDVEAYIREQQHDREADERPRRRPRP